MSGINSVAGYSNNVYFKARQQSPSAASSVNFRGDDYPYYNQEPKKSHKGLWITLGTLTAVAGGIFGLGYAHKYNVLEKLGDGKIKDFLYKWGNPAMETCHNWCKSVKHFGVENWNKVRNFFKGD